MRAGLPEPVLSRGTQLAPHARPATVNGAAGAVVARGGATIAVVGFTTSGGQIVEIDVITDREKLRGLTPEP